MKCKCIENTTIDGIDVGSEYKYNIVNGTADEVIPIDWEWHMLDKPPIG